MKWRRFIPHILLFFGGLGYAVWSFVRRPFPMLGENPLFDLMDYHTPNFYGWVMLWYYVSPFATLPAWPLDPEQKAPAIVIGEVHHPVEAREIFNPS